MSDFLDTNPNFGRDYGTGDWDQIKANFPREAMGVKLVSIEDRVPPKELIPGKAKRAQHRKRILLGVISLFAVFWVLWMISPVYCVMAGLALAFCLACALKIEGVW